VSVEFRTATAGQVRVESLALRAAQGLNFTEGTDRAAWPASRAEWQAAADSVPGASLVSWTGADEDRGFRSTAVLGFTNARALEGLFAFFKQKLTLLQDQAGAWTLTFQPQVPRVTAATAETRRLWTTLWGAEQWTFAFSPPGQPKTVRTVTLSDLAGAQPPADWTLTW